MALRNEGHSDVSLESMTQWQRPAIPQRPRSPEACPVGSGMRAGWLYLPIFADPPPSRLIQYATTVTDGAPNAIAALESD